MAVIEAGQSWRCSLGKEVRVVIGRVEDEGVHVQVTGLPNGTIGHLPFTHEAILGSVTTRDDEAAEPSEVFVEGYEHWKEAKGGFFSAALFEVVPQVLGIALDEDDAGIDEAVAQMRRNRDDQLIPVLYRRAMALPRWFFVADPEDPSAPLRMVFDERPDMPAVLVFTSRAKAIHCAERRGFANAEGEVHVRPAPVGEAVHWLVEGLHPSGVVYASFNLEGLDFPIYLDQLERLWDELGPGDETEPH